MAVDPIKIGGVTLPTPNSLEFERADLDSEKTGRSIITGKLKRVRIRKGARTATLKWENISQPELYLIAVQTDPISVTVEIFDGARGTAPTTYTMYAAPLLYGLVGAYKKDKPEQSRWYCELTLIEV